jgi:GDP-L-fucose synthase
MSFWNDRKVAITGGAGFLGSHLAEKLCKEGAQVVVLDMLKRGKTIPYGVEHVKVDVASVEYLTMVLRRVDTVFNLAAHVAGVIYNQQHQLEMFSENERLQVAPLLAAEAAGVEHFLQVSSVCVYAPEHNHPAREIDGHEGEPVNANNGYSWSKRIGERAAHWSRLPHVVIVRPSNLYGPRDYFDDRAHVIPALIRKALHDDQILVNGTGYERREFLYVEDAAAGLMAAMERGRHKEAYNIGTNGDTCVPIREVVGSIQALLDQDKPVTYSSDYDAGDPARWSDCTKAITELKWHADTPLVDGLAKTIQWYQEHTNARLVSHV